ncbi:hypothetical protein BaRGS_00015491 [Batillaria attramentaria]|uniref:Uncharacterized protein n=1 Tax=Batillaria attramentaria TaxID=370345 RepID=A0ABD0L234_9CAEN
MPGASFSSVQRKQDGREEKRCLSVCLHLMGIEPRLMARIVAVLVTSHFQLSPLASSNAKKGAECVSLPLPVHSLSDSKPYVVPPRGDTWKLSTLRTQAKLQGTGEEVWPPLTCGMQAHRCVDTP